MTVRNVVVSGWSAETPGAGIMVKANAVGTALDSVIVTGNASPAPACSTSGCVDTSGLGGGIAVYSGASLQVVDSHVVNNLAACCGGGIWLDSGGSMTMIRTVVAGNSARALVPSTGTVVLGGGGLAILGNVGIVNSTLSGNVVTNTSTIAGGGGILAVGGNFVLSNTTVSSNTASSGGGLYGGSGSVLASHFVNNSAALGGGMLFSSGSLVAVNDTAFATNQASDAGGGVYISTGASLVSFGSAWEDNGAAIDGGAIKAYQGVANLTGAQFVGNSAGRHGGAVNNYESVFTCINCTLSAHRAADSGGAVYAGGARAVSELTDTIFASNAAPFGPGGAVSSVVGASTALVRCVFAGSIAVAGGACFSTGTAATISLHGCLLVNNTATGSMGGGAGLATDSGLLTTTGTTFVSNTAPNGGGGGVFVDSSASAVLSSDSRFIANVASFGGGVAIASGVSGVTIGAAFLSNTATSDAVGTGGGLWTNSSLTLTEARFVANAAIADGAITGGAVACGVGSGATVTLAGFTTVQDNPVASPQAGLAFTSLADTCVYAVDGGNVSVWADYLGASPAVVAPGSLVNVSWFLPASLAGGSVPPQTAQVGGVPSVLQAPTANVSGAATFSARFVVGALSDLNRTTDLAVFGTTAAPANGSAAGTARSKVITYGPPGSVLVRLVVTVNGVNGSDVGGNGRSCGGCHAVHGCATLACGLHVATSARIPQNVSLAVAPGVYGGPHNTGLSFGGHGVTVASISGPKVTSIVCGGRHNGSASAVVFDKGEGTRAVLAGFTIANCTGGGVVVSNGSTPTLRDLVFADNTADDGNGGSGVRARLPPSIAGPLVWERLTFVRCTGTIGGGMYVVGEGGTRWNETELEIRGLWATSNSADYGAVIAASGNASVVISGHLEAVNNTAVWMGPISYAVNVTSATVELDPSASFNVTGSASVCGTLFSNGPVGMTWSPVPTSFQPLNVALTLGVALSSIAVNGPIGAAGSMLLSGNDNPSGVCGPAASDVTVHMNDLLLVDADVSPSLLAERHFSADRGSISLKGYEELVGVGLGRGGVSFVCLFLVCLILLCVAVLCV